MRPLRNLSEKVLETVWLDGVRTGATWTAIAFITAIIIVLVIKDAKK